jgi:hypothetical protein
MPGVFSAEAAVLAELEPLCRFLLVLRRRVVAPFAFEARQRDVVSHDWIRSIWSSGVWLSGCSIAVD